MTRKWIIDEMRFGNARSHQRCQLWETRTIDDPRASPAAHLGARFNGDTGAIDDDSLRGASTGTDVAFILISMHDDDLVCG
jgi:hypothetical protein